MSRLEPLIPVAVVGTARRELKRSMLPEGLGGGDLLAMAARAAVIDKVTLPAPSAGELVEPRAEHLPAPASPDFVSALHHALGAAQVVVVAEALRLLARRRRRLPVGTLHGVLEAAAFRRDLRRLLPPVLGERGSWLARLNPRWRFVELRTPDPDDEGQWHHGTRDERLSWLRAVRREDPDRARELLKADFGGEDASTRAALLATLATGLGPGDEAFLESALDDRGREVRAGARSLLAGLPDSAYVARMRARLAARVAPRLGERWRVELTGLTPEDRRDGVVLEADGTLPGATAIRALVAGVPLSIWAADFGYPATELVTIRAGSVDLSPLPGLRDAALREGDVGVAAAILAQPEWGADPELVRCLDAAQREALLPGRIRARGPADSVPELRAAPFGPQTASAVLPWVLENRSAGKRGPMLQALGSFGPIEQDASWDLATLLRGIADRLSGADQNRAFQAATIVNLRRALAAAID